MDVFAGGVVAVGRRWAVSSAQARNLDFVGDSTLEDAHLL